MPALDELEEEYRAARADPGFGARVEGLSKTYAGRPTPLYLARTLTEKAGGTKVYLKREDLAHTGAHKINNVLGQGSAGGADGEEADHCGDGGGAARGGGGHDLRDARAGVHSLHGREGRGTAGVERVQDEAAGAEVVSVKSGSRTLKDAINEAIRDWVTNVPDDALPAGERGRAAPLPDAGERLPVGDRQGGAGADAGSRGRLPDYAVACVGGGSNAMGMFHPFIGDEEVRLVGVEAAGEGIESGKHASSLGHGRPGVLHGSNSYLLAGPERAGVGGTQHIGGAGLPGGRARAQPLEVDGSGELCIGDG